MAKVDQLISTASAGGTGAGPTMPLSSPQWEGVVNVGRGLANLGQSIAMVGANQKKAQEQVKKIEDMKWLDTQYSAYQRSISDFENNPENSSREDFEVALWDYTTQLRAELIESAPSAEAAAAFESQSLGFATRRYASASDIASKNRVNSSIEKTTARIQEALHAFRMDSNRTGAVENLIVERDVILNNVEHVFGEMAPGVTEKIQSQLDEEIILAVHSEFPTLAQTVLDGNKTFSGPKRKQLGDLIKRSQEVPNLLIKHAFGKRREQQIFDAQRGQSFDTIPLEEYQAIYGVEEGLIHKSEDDARISGYAQAHNFLSEVGHTNAQTQISELNKLAQKIEDPTQMRIFQEVVEPTIRANLKVQENNSVLWLSQNNPEIKRIQSEFAAASEDMKEGIGMELYDAILKYQGYAPVDAENPEQYLNRPSGMRHVMDVNQAREVVKQINSGSPQEALQAISETVAQYPTEQQQAVAFNDLVTLGNLRQEYQLAYQNKDAWWIDAYIGALQGSDAIGKISEEETTELEGYLSGNALWGSFQTAMLGANYQRAEDIAGFKNGILIMAKAQMLRGKRMRDAVNEAVDMMIGSTLAFTETNGRPMVISRERSDGTSITDDEVDFIGEALEITLRRGIPWSEINPRNFSAHSVLTPGSEKWVNQVRRDIRRNGFWVTNNDGKSATLWIENKIGELLQLTDKNNKTFEVRFEDVLDSQTMQNIRFSRISEILSLDPVSGLPSAPPQLSAPWLRRGD